MSRRPPGTPSLPRHDRGPGDRRDPPARPRHVADWSWRHTLIVLAVLATFGRVASHEFTWWDDRMTIGANERFNPPTIDSLWFYWTHSEHGLYVPVTQTAWWALAHLARLEVPDERGIALNPWLYHGFNVAVHAISGLLAFALLRRLLGNDAGALVGSLLFALHPVQVETVSWASGTKDLLAWCFVLATLLAHLRGHDAERPTAAVAWRAVAALLAILAMLSKPTAIVLPLLALAIDRVALRRDWRTAIGTVAPWLAAAIVVAWVTSRAQPAPQVPDVPLHLRPLVAMDAVAFYLKQVAWPMDLAIDHGRRPAHVLSHWWGYVTWIAPVALAAALLLLRRRAPLLLLAGCMFVIPLLPLLGFRKFLFQYFSTVAEHYLYFSLLGVGLAAGWTVVAATHASSRRRSRLLAFAWSAILVLLAVRSFLQAATWRDDFTLFGHALRINPRSFLSYNNLGYAYLLQYDIASAERHFRRAVEIEPEFPVYRRNLAEALIRLGRAEEGIAELDESLRLVERHAWAGADRIAFEYLEAAPTAEMAGRSDRAVDYLRRAIELSPGQPRIRERLDEVQSRRSATGPSTRASP